MSNILQVSQTLSLKGFCPESRITFNTLCITLANQSFTVPVDRFKV